MKRVVAALTLLLAGPLLAGCSMLPRQGPADTVQRALASVADHDLAAAAGLACADRRNPMDLPMPLPGIFEPVGALPGFDVPRTLSVIELDVSGLTVSERSREGSMAEIDIDGSLRERFDPAQVEALFRAYAAESGQPLEQDLLDQTLANVSGGPVDIEIHETVPVIFEDNAWRICPPAPTP
jgi:hypothetical protein